MSTEQTGYLSEAQLDRVNLKTMAQGGLPEPYAEWDIFGALKATQQWYLDEGPEELTSEEALEKAVDWYCTTPNNEVVRAFERLQDNHLFKTTRELVQLIHHHPEAYEEFLRSQGLI